jgi:Family of unknown function (DUF6152)
MVLALLICAAAASTALAHHGWTGYDADKTTNLTGTIRESSYDNPHATVRLQADGETGKTWTAILAPPSRMQARGLSSDAIKPGTKATLVGYPSRSNPDEMRIERIIINGKTTELR